MDEEKIKELKKETEVDNSELEEIMKKELTVESQNEFFDVFRKSQLFLPVTCSANIFEGLEDAKPGDVFEPEGRVGFDINYLSDNEENLAVPLFTSCEVMEAVGVRSSVMAIFMSDLADMLRQTERYSVIAVNPFTDNDINMPIDVFLNLFEAEGILDALNTVMKILKEKSVILEEDYAFFARGTENFMKDAAVDGVFVPNVPFNVSTNRNFKEDMLYLNILLMPKGKRIAYLGEVVDDDAYDTIIAPGSEFHMVKEIDEFTTVWKCGDQPFYDEL